VGNPIRIGILDDFEVIVRGVASMLDPYSDRIEVVETATGGTLAREVDIALFDSFARGEAHSADAVPVLEDPSNGRVVMYTWNFDAELVRQAQERGFSSYLSKGLPGDALADALEQVHAGHFVVDDRGSQQSANPARPFPGAAAGLTEREAEVLALIAQGKSNAEISHLLFLSRDGTKSRIRRTYRHLGLRNRREAIRWALSHGFGSELHQG
jgi:DNA-binding NarL/FixJ family response regulator